MSRASAGCAAPTALATSLAAGLLLAPQTAFAAGALNLEPDVAKLVINLVVFALLIYPVNRFLLAPLVGVLQERESRSAGASQRAVEVTNEVGRMRGDIDQRLTEARARAQARRVAILAEAHEEENRLTSGARSDASSSVDEMRQAIESELVSARAGLEQDARTLAREAASRILDRSL